MGHRKEERDAERQDEAGSGGVGLANRCTLLGEACVKD